MTTAHVTETVAVSADTAWQLLSDFGGMAQKVLPEMIVSCTVEGQGLGATRDLALADGGSIVETMSKLDEAGKTFSYTLDRSTLPLKDYEATVKLTELGADKCQIDWSSVFEPDGVSEQEAIEFVTGLYQTVIAGLRAYLGIGSAAAE